jgi:hypothetical protein
MRFPKLTAFIFILALASCDKSPSDREKSYSKTGVAVTAAQSIPALPTSGSGTLDIEFTPVAKTLNYKITWSNLTDSVLALRINGPSPAGYNSINTSFTGANPTYATTTPHLVVQEFTAATTANQTKSLYGKNGSFSGSLFIDGVKVKEEMLMEGLYYFTIHTKTTIPAPATPPTSLAYRWIGELRAQIIIK